MNVTTIKCQVGINYCDHKKADHVKHNRVQDSSGVWVWGGVGEFKQVPPALGIFEKCL